VTERLLVALRTLMCINNYQHPDPADIASLRNWVDLTDRSAHDDELARIVIDTEIHRRKEMGMHLVSRAAS